MIKWKYLIIWEYGLKWKKKNKTELFKYEIDENDDILQAIIETKEKNEKKKNKKEKKIKRKRKIKKLRRKKKVVIYNKYFMIVINIFI